MSSVGLMFDEWSHVHTWLVLAAIAVTVVSLAPVAGRALRAPSTAREEVGVAVSA